MRDITKYSVALASLALGIIGAGVVSVVVTFCSRFERCECGVRNCPRNKKHKLIAILTSATK